MTPPPAIGPRLLASIVAGAAAAIIAWVKVSETGYASDFSMFWVAGGALNGGQNPYDVIRPGGMFAFDGGFMYPMPAALAVTPLAHLPVFSASVLFVTVGFACLAFGLTRDGWWRLPILLGFPTLWCIRTGQWAPVVMAAAMTPAFAWAAACKPTLGLVSFAFRPSWKFVAVAGLFALGTLAAYPTWPADWLTSMRTLRAPGSYHIPLAVPGGILLLLAALKWRTPEGRLLLAMSAVPQTMLLYDQLALGLIARSRMQAILFGLWSYGSMLLALLLAPRPFPTDKPGSLGYMALAIVWGYYLPALVVVLSRPNEGWLPEPFERLASRLPRWLRGQSATRAHHTSA